MAINCSNNAAFSNFHQTPFEQKFGSETTSEERRISANHLQKSSVCFVRLCCYLTPHCNNNFRNLESGNKGHPFIFLWQIFLLLILRNHFKLEIHPGFAPGVKISKIQFHQPEVHVIAVRLTYHMFRS